MLTIQDLHVSVEEKEILKGVHLQVKPGEIHAIMGPNGSGKSTLAYALAGHPHYAITKGSVLLHGKDMLVMSADERARQGLFLAFQYPAEIGGVSVQNMLRTAYEARFGKVESVLKFREYVQTLAKELGIREELVTRNVNEGFSGGEKKKVEILQMAVLKPAYAILDETDSGLDVDAMKSVAKGVKDIIKKHKTGVIVITHYQRILKYLKPDVVHVFVNGNIVKSGDRTFAQTLEREGYTQYV